MTKLKDFKNQIKNIKTGSNLVGKIKVRVLVSLTLVIGVLAVGQLIFASNLAVHGQKIAEIDNTISELEARNTTLKVEIAKTSSLFILSQKADSLGFSEPSEIITSQ